MISIKTMLLKISASVPNQILRKLRIEFLLTITKIIYLKWTLSVTFNSETPEVFPLKPRK